MNLRKKKSLNDGKNERKISCEVPGHVTVNLPPVSCKHATHLLHLNHHGLEQNPNNVHGQGAEKQACLPARLPVYAHHPGIGLSQY